MSEAVTDEMALLPCPFCGAEASLVHPFGSLEPGSGKPDMSLAMATCSDITCASISTYMSPAKATACWNQRAAAPPNIINVDDPQADDATHLHAGDENDISRWGRIRKELARIPELEAQLADARSANERNRSQFAELIGGLDTAMQSHAWLMDEGRGPYEWDDDRYRDEFAAASKTLKEHLQPLRDTAKDWTDCPTDWDAVKASRLSVESLIAERDQARAHLAQMREDLQYIRASLHADKSGQALIRIMETLTSTESTTTTYRDQIRREALEEAAKVAEAYPSGAVSRNSTGDKIATAIRALTKGDG